MPSLTKSLREKKRGQRRGQERERERGQEAKRVAVRDVGTKRECAQWPSVHNERETERQREALAGRSRENWAVQALAEHGEQCTLT